MPNITVRVPLLSNPPLARRRGVGAILTQQPVYLPGPNVFTRGLGAITIRQPVVLPGPNLFKGLGGLRRRGLAAFTIKACPAPVLPGPNIFARYANARNCMTCARPCGRRGLGQDIVDIPSADSFFNATPTVSADTFSTDLFTSPDLLSSSYSSTQPYLLASGSSLEPQNFLVNPSLIGAGLPSPTPASSNPSLDLFNQSLTNAQANAASPASSLTSAQLAALGISAGSATAAQLIKASQTLNTQAAKPTTAAPAGYQWTLNPTTGQWQLTAGTSLTTWLSQSTLLSGYTNGTVAFGGVAIVVLLGALASGKKKR